MSFLVEEKYLSIGQAHHSLFLMKDSVFSFYQTFTAEWISLQK